MRNDFRLKRWALALSAVLITLPAANASGDSFGSWGSSGGSSGFSSSSGGYGSSGGGRHGLFGGTGPVRNLLGRLHDRVHHRVSHWGSSGGRGSSGGSSGGWGSSGGTLMNSGLVGWGSSGGSYSNYGSSGGSLGTSVGYYPADAMGTFQFSNPVDSFSAPNSGAILNNSGYPIYEGGGDIQPPKAEGVAPAGEGSGGAEPIEDKTVLKLKLPADGKVFVNGKPTKSTGAERNFVARRLVPGKVYTFEVKAVVERDGVEEVRTEIVSARAGDFRELNFDFDRPQSMVTTLAVDVPADAKVILAGNESNQMGSSRIFSTEALKPGESWSDYKIIAQIERNGRVITEEKTLDVVAGQSYRLSFDFSDNGQRLASRQ